MTTVFWCVNFEAGEVFGVLILANLGDYIGMKTFLFKIHIRGRCHYIISSLGLKITNPCTRRFVNKYRTSAVIFRPVVQYSLHVL